MSWFSQKSKFLTQKSYGQDQNSKSIQAIQQQVLMSIESIQQFYNLNSQRKLINLILDKKQSAKLFSRKQSAIVNSFRDDQFFQSQKQQKRIIFFAQKYSYEALVQKFPKPKSGTNQLLLRILEKKMQKGVITSHQTRKGIWLLASGAKFNMVNNKDLYQNLLKISDYPKYFQRSIIQDLHRTVNKQTSFSIQEDISKLKNVLIAFSRRNPFIGYCQGLNFIAFFLLTMQFTEEEAFFLLSTMLESIIPMDYYTNMIGVVCDQQIFINILKVLKPHIVQKFDQLGLDPSVLSIQWFVCLFTSSLPFYLVKIVWDRLLVEGTRAFIKTGLIILSYFQDSIMQATQFHEIIMILEKGSKNLQVSETDFNLQFEKYYIDKKGLKIARDLYRQYHIKQKLEQKVVTKRGKIVHPKCNLKWPICVSRLERLKRQRQQIDVWIYRAQNPPKIIHDYLSNKPHDFKDKVNITGTFISSGTNSTNLFESIKNVNQQKQQVQQQIQKTHKQQNEPQSPFKKTKINKKPSKSISKDELNQLLQSKNPKKRSGELIIGRMDHICQKELIQLQKIKKTKKSDIKFLSMIFEDSQQPKQQNNQQKRSQTYKKIAKVSHIFQDDKNDPTKIQQKSKEQIEEKQQKRQLSKQQRALLAQSRTINFYNQFIQNNKELSSIICGVDNIEANKQQNQFDVVQQQEQEESQHDIDIIQNTNKQNESRKINITNESQQTIQQKKNIQN